MQELAEQIAKTKWETVAKQETRWSENSLIKINNYSFYYGGSSTTGQAGTSLIIMKKVLKYILGFEPYNGKYVN